VNAAQHGQIDLAPTESDARTRLRGLLHALDANPHSTFTFTGPDGACTDKNFAEVAADVRQLALELRGRGLHDGDVVGIVGDNSYEWVLADLACLELRCTSVALTPAQCRAPGGIGEVVERYQLNAVLATHIVLDPVDLCVGDLSRRPLSLKRRSAEPLHLPDDVFTIVFSSGTSGRLKGLMLTEGGVENTIRVSAKAWRLDERDNILIVLPYSNFQQRYLTYAAIACGANVTVVPPEHMFLMMKRLAPTVILGPPSFFEILANRLRAASFRGRLRYRVAMSLATIAPRSTASARRRLGRPYTGVFGPAARLMMTGSAPVPPHVVRLFDRFAMPLFEIYGSSEVGWIAFNTPGAARIGTAGRPVAGVRVEITDDGEVLVGTAHPQCAGYIFDGVETSDDVFRPDGMIATGDVGAMSRDGYLTLLGRKKNVIITRSGVKLSPEELENDLARQCGVDQVMVIASPDNASLWCIVWIADRSGEAENAGIAHGVRAVNGRNPAYAQIVKTFVRDKAELTSAPDLLTRNLKLQRDAVLRHLAAERAFDE